MMWDQLMTPHSEWGSPRDIGDVFPAQYSSLLDCGHDAHWGDPVAYVEGELVCAQCREEAL